MTNKYQVEVVYTPEPPPGPLGAYGIYTIALGTVMGVGLLSYLPTAIAVMGLRASLWFPLVVLLTIFYAAPYFFFASTVRSAGGLVGVVAGMCNNPYVLGIYQCTTFLAPLYLALFGVSFAMYFRGFFPGANPIAVGVGLLAVFYVVNLLGVDWMARLQNAMLPTLLVGLAIYVVFAFANQRFPVFDMDSPAWSIGGFTGWRTGVFLLLSMSVGYISATSVGRLAKNAIRDTPKAMIWCVVSLVLSYTLVGVATTIVLPPDMIGQTLSAVAHTIFPQWLFVPWLLVVAGFLIATTVNGMFVTTTEGWHVACLNGFLPKSFGYEDKNGTKVILLTIIFILGTLPVIMKWDITDFASYMQFMTYVSEMIALLLMYRFPTTWKRYWEQSKYHVPNWVFYFFVTTSIIFKNAMMYTAFITMKPQHVIFTVSYVALCLVWVLYRIRTGNVTFTINVWADGINVADPRYSREDTEHTLEMEPA
ncbi:MAG: APC family permease [Thermacetogeniaceae bacterium]|jgi:amino acid transporter